MQCLHIEVAKITVFFFRGKIRPLLGSFSVKFHQRLILSFLVTIFLVTKRSKYLKYIFAIPSLRFRSDALKKTMNSCKESQLDTALSDYYLKMKILLKEFSINFKSLWTTSSNICAITSAIVPSASFAFLWI